MKGALAECWPEPCAKVLDIKDLLALDIPPRDILLAPWLQSQSLAMIHAWRGTGKTHVALNVAYAVASGGSYLNWSAPKPRKVLYLDGEMPAATLKERLALIVSVSEVEPTKGYLRIVTPDVQPETMPNLASTEGQDSINRVIEDDTSLIVVDNISCLLRGSERENDAESWQAVSTWALKMRAQGRSVLFIHHSGKGGTQRGTSKREDLLDTVIALKRPIDYLPHQGARFEIHYEKSRGLHGSDVDSIEASLGANHVWSCRQIEDAALSRLVDLVSEGASQTECMKALEMDRFKVRRLRKKAYTQGLLTSPTISKGGKNVRAS